MDDEFWEIALSSRENENAYTATFKDEHSNDQCKDTSVSCDHSQPSVVYNLEFCSKILSIRLSPLPPSDGVWSPLGAHAWYGSALLASLLLQYEKDDHLSLLLKHDSRKNLLVLELGSGAVGLSSLAAALCLSSDFENDDNTKRQLILTDNDAQVLQNLQRNIDRNVQQFDTDGIKLPTIKVCKLDWNSKDVEDFVHKTASIDDYNNKFDLVVIGSELVYTPEIGKACANTVLQLLQLPQCERVLVVIVQIVDRSGWDDVFLESLRSRPDLASVRVEPVSYDLHISAQKLIPRGGSLDRFDFGVCYITRASNVNYGT